MKAKDMGTTLTVERLKQALHYDPATGTFVWCETGKVAGASGSKDGYIRLWLEDARYLAHRLAWLYMTGEWPQDMVDHINRDKSDNRWVNLRAATNSQNKANGSPYKKRHDLPKGVQAHDKNYRGQLTFDGKHYRSLSFKTIEAAQAWYAIVATNLHGEFVNPSA